ncbi:Insulin domain containing protein [Asbolus verrucosus]|uniref:Insulin domain containing protein n=1 Tax=Asbolus verrucosus TaxID=1661398 RepID=A0A482VP73_ASBVE|nr:Insulin domain containing protein [Asbolus verrucosus]
MDLQYVFVVVATVLAGLHSCQMEEAFRGQNSKKIYCGKHLSQTLSAVCKGNYNTLTKKTDIYDTWDAQYTADGQRGLDFPYRSKVNARSLITHYGRRRRRGVFNECCEKPCSHEELSSYCGSRK